MNQSTKTNLYCANCGVEVSKDKAIMHYFRSSEEYFCPECRMQLYPIEITKSDVRVFGFKDENKKEEKPKINSESDIWENEYEQVKTCCNIPIFTVQITGECYLKIKSLMATQKNKEWLAYLQGEIKDDKPKNENDGNHEITYTVNDLFIPKQVVSYASVNVVNSELPENCIGVMHSHHSMGAFMSSTDRDWINSNHNLSIVVAKDDMKAQVRYFSPCSNGTKYFVIEPEVDLLLPVVDTSNIETPSSRYTKRIRGLTAKEIEKEVASEQEELPFYWD